MMSMPLTVRKVLSSTCWGARQGDGDGGSRQNEAKGAYFPSQGLRRARQGSDEAYGGVGDGAFRPAPAAEDDEAQDEG